MKDSIFTLSTEEYNALDKIIKGCKMDCLALIKQGPKGDDYVCDTEWDVLFPLRSGVSLLMQGLGSRQNLDNCSLSDSELEALEKLLIRLNVPNDIFEAI